MGARQVVWLGLLAMAGCGGGAAVNRAPVAPTCETRHPAKNPSDTLTVVLFDKVDLSHAPWGRNREERFVFSHLYETLATVDCQGKIQPALAKSIQEGSDGWLITLRDNALFWDDEPVSSVEVVESFKAAIAGGLAIKSVVAIDERTVLVQGYDGRPDPKLLTLPMVSIIKPGDVIPMGTGAWMIDESMPIEEAIVIRPVDAIAPTVRFVQGNVSDARDLMSGTADALITDDPAAIEYARLRESMRIVPLSWDIAYFLTSVRHLENYPALDQLPDALRDNLARDVVRKDARGGTSLLVASAAACGIVLRAPNFNRTVTRRPRDPDDEARGIMFNSNDQVARDLAERIVALLAMQPSTSAQADSLARILRIGGRGRGQIQIPAVAAEPTEFFESFKGANQVGYVFSLSWCADFPLGIYWFAEHAAWLAKVGSQHIPSYVVPLVETRPHLVAISDRIGYVDDHNGAVRIQPVHVGATR